MSYQVTLGSSHAPPPPPPKKKKKKKTEGVLWTGKFIFSPKDLVSKLLPTILPAIQHGLQDPDDDVRAVAASALIPVTDALGQYMPDQVS